MKKSKTPRARKAPTPKEVGIFKHGKSRAKQQRADVDKLIASAPAAFDAAFIEEPLLVFSNGRTAVDPKSGLLDYGPVGPIPTFIRLGVVGTPEGVDAFSHYLQRAKRPILPGLNKRGKHYDPLAFPDFPGIAADRVFRTEFVTDSSIQRTITNDQFDIALNPTDPSAKVKAVIEMVTKELRVLADQEPAPNVVVVVMPPSVEKECRGLGAAFQGKKVVLSPTAKVIRKLEKTRAKTGQEFLPLLFLDSPEQELKGFWNIHHALKAHAMDVGLATQLVWEPTLRGEGLTQDQASMAWNLFTALYYKAGNIPWHIASVPEGTCFVGISFYKESPHRDAAMHTSLAQVFSGVGEGLVLKGERAVVDKTRGDKRAHMTEQGAQALLSRAISLYEQHHNGRPKRVVVHKTSRFWPEELAGFKKGLGDVKRYDFLALERLETRFMRLGQEPPLRGSLITLAPRYHLMFTVGYVPYFGLYPGMRVPNPLAIVEHWGDSPSRQVCQEVLSLTKINWNSCAFACSDPITIQFARTVGRILTEIPGGTPKESKYKFYM